jgi:hypothetical protein
MGIEMADQKRIRHQLHRLTDQEDISIEFISALSGDRALSPSENKRYQKLSTKRGELLYVDLLFVITHQYFPPEKAKRLWKQIREHKKNLARQLGRNVGKVAVFHDIN